MTEHVSATLVDQDTLLVDGVTFDRRKTLTITQMDGTAKGRRLDSLYHGGIQRMELCQRIVHLEALAALLWGAVFGDDESLDQARSETRALGLG